MRKAEAFVKRDRIKSCVLYMIYGTEDSHRVTEYVPDFQEFLKSKAPLGFMSQLKIIKGEGHVPKSSKSRGLRYVFFQNKSWDTLDFAEKENGNGRSLRLQNPRAQYIFIIPEHDMVVIVNGDTRSGIDQRKPIEFLYTHILKSVQR